MFGMSNILFKKFWIPVFTGMTFVWVTPSLTSRPYITGNGFRAAADYIVEHKLALFDPVNVKPRSVVYVEVDSLGFFFEEIFPHIKNPFILVSHNGDMPAPGAYAAYLNDPKIIRWFGQNGDIEQHVKFSSIPIGLANPKWTHGNTKIFDQVLDDLEKRSCDRDKRLYINFFATNNVAVRQPL